jgi:hypothetical protein
LILRHHSETLNQVVSEQALQVLELRRFLKQVAWIDFAQTKAEGATDEGWFGSLLERVDDFGFHLGFVAGREEIADTLSRYSRFLNQPKAALLPHSE